MIFVSCETLVTSSNQKKYISMKQQHDQDNLRNGNNWVLILVSGYSTCATMEFLETKELSYTKN